MEADSSTIHASAALSARAPSLSAVRPAPASRASLSPLLRGVASIFPFARLVATTARISTVADGRLVVRPAHALEGLIEVRGLGIRALALRARRPSSAAWSTWGCRGRADAAAERARNASFPASILRDLRSHPAPTPCCLLRDFLDRAARLHGPRKPLDQALAKVAKTLYLPQCNMALVLAGRALPRHFGWSR